MMHSCFGGDPVGGDPPDVEQAKPWAFSQKVFERLRAIVDAWWATGYNLLAIPLAAGVLYGAGIVLSPAVGAALMSLSTVIVAINARLLSRANLKTGEG